MLKKIVYLQNLKLQKYLSYKNNNLNLIKCLETRINNDKKINLKKINIKKIDIKNIDLNDLNYSDNFWKKKKKIEQIMY